MAFDVGSDRYRLDALKGKSPIFAPPKELAYGLSVCSSGIHIANVCGEEFEEPPSGMVTGIGDEGGQKGAGRRNR
jgi:hypothetical protein